MDNKKTSQECANSEIGKTTRKPIMSAKNRNPHKMIFNEWKTKNPFKNITQRSLGKHKWKVKVHKCTKDVCEQRYRIAKGLHL